FFLFVLHRLANDGAVRSRYGAQCPSGCTWLRYNRTCVERIQNPAQGQDGIIAIGRHVAPLTTRQRLVEHRASDSGNERMRWGPEPHSAVCKLVQPPHTI